MSKHKHLMTRDEYRQKEENQQQTTINNMTAHSGNNEPQQKAVPTAQTESGLSRYLKLFIEGVLIVVAIVVAIKILKVFIPWIISALIIGSILYFLADILF